MKTNIVTCTYCPTKIDTYNDNFESGVQDDGSEYYACQNCWGN